ncbi:MAG: molybdate ABC transporter substrate-binding protein [Thiohalomonadales bacterium]
MTILDWPLECAQTTLTPQQQWSHSGSNLCLDFHGDPLNAKLVVYSDGNHHMALLQSVQEFLKLHPEVDDIFYATTPPGVLVKALQDNGLILGNLKISTMPNVFIGPEAILSSLVEQKYCEQYTKFIQSRGNVALVLKGNPLNIRTSKDLFKDDVRLFLSNPQTEKASYQVYHEFLINSGLTQTQIDSINTYFGRKIHHREAPQALVDGNANVAIVYYHLALRYCRIFPEIFDLVEILPCAGGLNPVTEYAIGLVADGGEFGELFVRFMQSETVSHIYQQHGLNAI